MSSRFARLLFPTIAIAIVMLSLPRLVSAQSDISELQLGKVIERELKAGETHSYDVTLKSGQYLHVIAEQIGIDVIVKILGPSHEQIAEVNNWKSLRHSEQLSLVAKVSGDYHLEVRSLEPDAIAGRYRLSIKTLAGATEQDKKHITAYKLVIESERLRAQDTTESRRRAIEKYNEALWVWQALNDRNEEAETLYQIGTVFGEQADNRKSLDYYEQALALMRATGNTRMEARILTSLGAVFRFLGENQKALESYTMALSLQRAANDRQYEAITLNCLGEFYYYVGDQLKAQEYYEEALKACQSLGDVSGETEVLGNLGVTYRVLGEPQKALQYFSRALPTTTRLGRSYIHQHMARVYYEMGDFEKALDSYEHALQIRQELGIAAEWTLLGIGTVYRSLGQPEKALESYNQALSRLRVTGDRQGEAQALYGIGEVHASSGQPQKALEYYDNALAFQRGVGDRRGQAETLNHIGAAYRALGERQKAFEYYREALSIQRAINDRIGEAQTLYNVAYAHRNGGQLNEAQTEIEAALSIIESLRSRVANQQLRASYLASKQDSYQFYIDLLMRRHLLDPSAGYAAAALQASERARARSLLEVLNEGHADIRQGGDAKLVEREEALQRLLNAQSERLMRLGGKPDEKQAREVLESLLTEYQEIEAQIRSSSPRYAALTQPLPLSLEAIQGRVLDDETLLLEYSLGDEKSFLFAVTKNSIKSFELPKRATIEDAARRVYDSLTARNKVVANEKHEEKLSRIARSDVEYLQSATTLSQIVLGPAASELGQKRLLIVSEGALQYVPFGALPAPGLKSQVSSFKLERRSNSELRTPNGGTPLIVDHEVVTLPSASVLAALRQEVAGRKPANKSVAVLADPVFVADDPRVTNVDSPGNGGAKGKGIAVPTTSSDVIRSAAESGVANFVRLRFSREEADVIARLAPEGGKLEAVDFIANRATATSADLGQYRIVHFATHGLINSQHPDLSGVVLSLVDEKGQPQNGFLRLYEIYNLKLNADLVVLSACQTALGKEIKGEGLIGLTRGFMYSGAPRVVASLWRIDDRATAELMKRFYTGMLSKNLAPAAALRAAQVSMAKDKRWSTPYYWAAFTIQGEWK